MVWPPFRLPSRIVLPDEDEHSMRSHVVSKQRVAEHGEVLIGPMEPSDE